MPVVEGRPSSSPSSSQPSVWRSPSSLPSSLLRPLVPAFFLIVVPTRLCLVGSCQVDLTLSGLLCASSVIRNDGRGEALLLMHMMLLLLVVRRQVGVVRMQRGRSVRDVRVRLRRRHVTAIVASSPAADNAEK